MTISQYRGEGAVNRIGAYYSHLAYAWAEATTKGYEPVLEVQWEWNSSDSNQEANIAIVVCEGFQSASCTNLWKNTVTMEFIAELPMQQENAQDMVYIDMSKYATKRDYSVALDEYESYDAWDAMYAENEDTAHPSSVNMSANRSEDSKSQMYTSLDTERMLNILNTVEPYEEPVPDIQQPDVGIFFTPEQREEFVDKFAILTKKPVLSLQINCPTGTSHSHATYIMKLGRVVSEEEVCSMYGIEFDKKYTWGDFFTLDEDTPYFFISSFSTVGMHLGNTLETRMTASIYELLTTEEVDLFSADMSNICTTGIRLALLALVSMLKLLKSRLQEKFPAVSLYGSIEL